MSSKNEDYVLPVAMSDQGTAIVVGVAVTLPVLVRMAISQVQCSLGVVSSAGIVTVNIKKNGATIFTTKVTIDANEASSLTAAAAAVLIENPTLISPGDVLSFEIDGAGTGAKGLCAWLLGNLKGKIEQ